jgi:hypothetical protein
MEQEKRDNLLKLLDFYNKPPREKLVDSLRRESREYLDGVIKPPQLTKDPIPKLSKNPIEDLISGPSDQQTNKNSNA